MKHQSTLRSILTGFAITMAVATATATAQPVTDAKAPASPTRQSMSADACGWQQRMQSGPQMDGYGMQGSRHMSARGQGGMPGMGNLPASLVEQLSLTDKQKVALLDAQTAAQAMHESSRQIRDAHRQAIRTSAAQQSFDPRAMIEQQNKMRESMQAIRDAVQKKWLSFWDGLSKEQQAKVSAYMKQNMSRHGGRSMGPRAG